MSREYELNEDIFNVIDDEEKAYWLGFLYADGAIYIRKRKGHGTSYSIHLNLSSKDYDHLVKFANFIGTNKPARKFISNGYDTSGIEINSKNIAIRLIQYGCVEKKSLVLGFPIWLNTVLGGDLIRHFVRGYFDGDGFFEKRRLSIVSTESFLTELQKIITDVLNIKSYIRPHYSNNNGITKYLWIEKKKDIMIFLNWLYNDTNVYLDRKYQKYLELEQERL